MDGKGYRAYIIAFIHLIKYITEKILGMTKFSPGDTKEHEGVTYVVVRQKDNETCEGCAFYKRGEPCKSPEDWLCVETTEEEPNDLIFKAV